MSEDPFYCGDLNQAEETSATSVFIEEKKKIWRIKTEKEFEETLGLDHLAYERDVEGCWNYEGQMNWLMGKPLHEVLKNPIDRLLWQTKGEHGGGLFPKRNARLLCMCEEEYRNIPTTTDSRTKWTIWPYYDVVYDYPV